MKVLTTNASPDNALLQHAQITALPHPNYDNLDGLCSKIYDEEAEYDGVCGAGNAAWGNLESPPGPPKSMAKSILPLFLNIFWKPEGQLDKRDLVTVHQSKKLDRLTSWVKQDWIPFYHYHLRNRVRAALRCCQRQEEVKPEVPSSTHDVKNVG